MSHSIYIDESNGNNLYSTIANQTTNSTYRAQQNLNNSPSSKSTTRSSNEDLSQSLSEYTDAEESMSAPTEFLAEFLSAVMLKDYQRAFEYCKLILQYEPNNATAKEFYPLIQEKLKIESAGENDENGNKSSSADGCADTDNDDDVDDDVDDDEVEEESVDDSNSNNSSSSDQSLNESEVATSEESDENLLDPPGSNNSSSGSGSGCYGISRSDNTTHSYSSLLLEEEDDVPQNINLRDIHRTDLDISNGNFISASCSDSESPTEPLTQRLAAILRSKCHPNDNEIDNNKK
ncbi:glutamate-rich protein 2 [Condylostylus longicornis]|uniref:glutamate-rich protein 2 n=1 Tax=Condylostylus longicornis TaxID=2530218 RepID=UPI00244E54FA|nr:glutamate-rich protein 2 [Condylostylus longicornis]